MKKLLITCFILIMLPLAIVSAEQNIVIIDDMLFDTNVVPATTFIAVADTPYSDYEATTFESAMHSINAINAEGGSESSDFLVHLGDIMYPGKDDNLENCGIESEYSRVKDILKISNTPVFIIPGDNEWADCAKSSKSVEYLNSNIASYPHSHVLDLDLGLGIHNGWNLWSQYFTTLPENEEKWTTLPYTVNRQAINKENFSFVLNDILYVGLNMPGISIPVPVPSDPNPEKLCDIVSPGKCTANLGYTTVWSKLMTNAGDWLEEQFNTYGDSVNGAVIFAHARTLDWEDLNNPPLVIKPHFKRFAHKVNDIGYSFDKPILYLEGDGHKERKDNPYNLTLFPSNPAVNITRVELKSDQYYKIVIKHSGGKALFKISKYESIINNTLSPPL